MSGVLVLEPDALQRDLICMALRRNGLDAVVCERSADVPVLLAQHQPALILLDIYQADKNGLDLLEELKGSGQLAATKVIVISSMAFPEIVRRATRLGAAGFLVKPINVDLLMERVQQVMGS
jgi:CheY-like chemotaxis protein